MNTNMTRLIERLQAMQRDASASQGGPWPETAGVSPSLVSRRLSRLKKAGILRAVVGLVDAEQAGLSRRDHPRAPEGPTPRPA